MLKLNLTQFTLDLNAFYPCDLQSAQSFKGHENLIFMSCFNEYGCRLLMRGCTVFQVREAPSSLKLQKCLQLSFKDLMVLEFRSDSLQAKKLTFASEVLLFALVAVKVFLVSFVAFMKRLFRVSYGCPNAWILSLSKNLSCLLIFSPTHISSEYNSSPYL